MFAFRSNRSSQRFSGYRTLPAWAFLVVSLSFVFASCSAGEPVQPAAPAPAATPTAESDEPPQETTESAGIEEPKSPTLVDDGLAEIVEIDAGEQVEDAQGNLIAIYGFARWPDPYANLPAGTRTNFPFVVDINDVTAASTVVALDVGMCTAGINAEGFGTVEFALAANPADPLLTAAGLSQTIVTRHSVVSPGFTFPPTGECERGWLPMVWSGDDDPAVARYLLSNRSSSDAAVEQHLYQWSIDTVDITRSELQFSAGETVTFNDGQLADTTVTVQGWAELVGRPSLLEGTRPVAVSVSFCPASVRLPDFGLGADDWNLIAPVDAGDGLFGALAAGDPSGDCFEGWLEFAVPHGAVPTSFFASDSRDPVVGYAEWTLENAALAPPPEQ